MNFKAIVSAVALAALGTAAHAGIQNSAAANPDLTVTLFNGAASYTLDLGVNATVLDTGLTTGYSFNLSTLDSTNFSAFLASAGTAALKWTVLAGETQSNTLYASALKGQEGLAGTNGSSDGFNTTLNSAISDYVAYTNNDATASVPTVNDSFQALATNAAKYYSLDGFNGALGFDSEANTVGTTSVALFKFQSVDGDISFVQNQTANIAGLTKNTAGQYILTIANATPAVTPSVPEPESYGLALVGLLLVGAVARRQAA
jgi:hypothetical protein